MSVAVNLAPTLDTLTGSRTTPAHFSAVAKTGGMKAVRTSGAGVRFPADLRFDYDGAGWSTQPALDVLPAGCYWQVRLWLDSGTALERSVVLPAGASTAVDFGALVDVDPRSAAAATPSQLSLFLAATDQKIAQQALVDAAIYLPRWQPKTAYLAAAIVVNPSGQIVRRKADGSSGTTYDPTAWDVVAGGAGAAAGVLQQATQTASFAAAAGSFYPVNASAGNVTVTLPTSAPGQVIQIKKLDANAAAGATTGIVRVTGTINGVTGATVPIRKQGMGKEYLADGNGGWSITLGDLDITQLGATATEQGFITLAGDLGGTAGAPTVPGLAGKASIADLAGKADLVGGLIPTSQIPSLALNTVVPVATRSAMLALTSTQVQPGDVAVDTSTGTTRGSYMLLNADPSVIGSWVQLTAPTDVVTSVNGQTGAIVLGKGDLGLSNVDNTSDANKPVSTATQTALDGKAPAAAGVPLGGAAGLFLRKASATDRDVAWGDPNFGDTFTDVSLGSSSGGVATQTLPANAFTNLAWANVNSDSGANWDTANKRYTVPADGLYLVVMRVRLIDGAPAQNNLGIGVHTAGVDGPWFQWNLLPASASGANQRQTYNYQRIARFTKGSPLLGYAYAAGAAQDISIAGMQIIRLA